MRTSKDGQTSPAPGVPVLRVRTAGGSIFRFSQPFHIGRDADCEVQIQDVHVSRRHVIVSFANGQWSLSDLQSSNGVFVDGQRVDTASVDDRLTISLGVNGPTLVMELERSSSAPQKPEGAREQPEEDTRLLARYFGPMGDEQASAVGR